MAFLIDGHNVINALSDIDITDPHDEAKLVEKLKGFAGRTGKRCVVVFDGGLPGGFSRDLSAGPVQVYFAAAQRTDADTLLIRRINRAPNPGALTLVSSDREVQAAARAKGVAVLTSDEFAAKLGALPGSSQAESAGDADDDEIPEDIQLDSDQVEAWLTLFRQRKQP